MNTKEQISLLLEQSGDIPISGKVLADRLGLTRAAVWKCIRQLTADGYEIESSRFGYRLGPASDALSANSVRTYLKDMASVFETEVFTEINSTNSYLRDLAAGAVQDASAPQPRTWHTVIASAQSAGRGRRGRTFVSPAGSGLYLSVLLRPQVPAEQATRITTAAAVAACRAIEANTDTRPQIKWVNDVFVHGKKVCGILTEASLDLETGGLAYAVMGIGFNVYEPESGFPEELRDIAGAIADRKQRDLRSRLAADFLREFHRLCSDLPRASCADEYRRRSFLIGQQIRVLSGNSSRPATALDVDGDCRLLVRYEDGTEEALSSGEVSVRPADV